MSKGSEEEKEGIGSHVYRLLTDRLFKHKNAVLCLYQFGNRGADLNMNTARSDSETVRERSSFTKIDRLLPRFQHCC